ncbi:hypothetical protein ACN28E_35530 [Archangium lansingense]|uniref:hypothetical protein n=1 Tax=Archangium lansingense TaxID=2995310 RepID=UPI003B7D1FB1
MQFPGIRKLVRPVVEIDGALTAVDWGTHSIPLDAGKHRIEIYVPWVPLKLGKLKASSSRSSPASVDVTLRAGELAELEYRTAYLVYLPGSIEHKGKN